MFKRIVTFRRLEIVSFCHSCIYISLLICAFAVHPKPKAAVAILGLAHGLLWIAMSLVCIVAARQKVIPFWLAVMVAVIGGLGPFCGSFGFVYEAHRRRSQAAVSRSGASA